MLLSKLKMPRPKNNTLHDLFDKNDSNQIVCNRGNCSGKVLNQHSGNLERHLRTVHPELYANYIKQKGCLQYKNNVTKAKLSKEVNKHNIELAIVELFTKNGRPLRMIEDRAFKTLVQPVFDVLNISVNEHNINERIIAFSQKLKTETIEDLKGKLLSLKIDAATRQDLSVLGINVQYIKSKCIKTKTLAIKELKSSHTSEYLKSIILEVLKDYSVDINQILTITTDNGANMLKTVSDLNTDLKNSLEDECFDNDLTAESLESIRSEFSFNSITCVRCGAHTLQLCVNDVLKTNDIKAKLDKCRSVAKKLRTPTYLNILKNGRYRKPILDCVTRWNSTFNMLERLYELKDVIDSLSLENSDLKINNDIWNFIDEFIKTFNPVRIATAKLQAEKLCFSELYIIIMDVLFQIENFPSNDIQTMLTDALNRRKSKLFDNELFNAAIFLDARIKVCLNSDQISRAKKCITSVHKRITSLKETISNSTSLLPQSLVENGDEPTSSRSYQTPKSFSEYLQNLDPVSTSEPMSLSLSHLETDLLMYERQPRLDLNANILEFWANQNNSLSVIADIVLAIPSTQVSVERLFSALKYILSDQRNRLTPFNLEHILLVRVNGEFNYED